MTRKDFKDMAEVIRKIRDNIDRRRTAEMMADFCATRNNLFNRSKFLDACGVHTTEYGELGK